MFYNQPMVMVSELLLPSKPFHHFACTEPGMFFTHQQQVGSPRVFGKIMAQAIQQGPAVDADYRILFSYIRRKARKSSSLRNSMALSRHRNRKIKYLLFSMVDFFTATIE